MTKIKIEKRSSTLKNIGSIIYTHRLNLSLEKDSRKFFLDDRVAKGILNPEDISEKTLSNIENGYNLPNLITINYLATALEVDFLELIDQIRPYIPSR